jgi:acyl-CoA reductase-like NAD-dependent aldehyde dehydrogenase
VPLTLELGGKLPHIAFADADLERAINGAVAGIFGLVWSVIPFDDENQAVELANSTKYGLASGLWTRDFSRAHRLSRSIHCRRIGPPIV